MDKTDGISDLDWEKVHGLVLNLVNASDEEEHAHRKLLLECLDDLELKYGVLPSLLSARADFIEDEARRESLYLKAYTVAVERLDIVQTLLAVQSLSHFYVAERRDVTAGEKWLTLFRDCLDKVSDVTLESEFKRLLKKAKLMAWGKDAE